MLAGDLEPGESFGPFVIRRCLGKGGMGVVYRAEDQRMRREVALKLLRPDGANPDHGRRLVREARAAGSLSHPNIATMFEVGEIAGRAFVAMELVEGESLAARLELGPLELADVAAIARQILDGLAAAHSAGIIHRDLKPANVMMTPRGLVKILDFGVATRLWEPAAGMATETLTLEGKVIGTPAYMAPEQARGETIDQRADLFAFGVMLFEMLTGRRPFEGRTVADVTSAVLRDPPPDVASLRPETPPSLGRVIERCLAKAPSLRYPTCAAVRADLERAAADATPQPSVAGAAAVENPGHADTVAEGDPPPSSPPSTSSQLQRRRRVTQHVFAGVILAGLVALIAIPFVVDAFGTPAPTDSTAPDPSPARGVTITGRPPPRSDRAEALGAYATALQAFRDANWKRAEIHLERAVGVDPGLAAAHLRLAVVRGAHRGARAARASYADAIEGRVGLDAHDRAMLDALEPLVGRAEVDTGAAAARWREASAAFPDDAEIAALAAFYEDDARRGLAYARRATRIDPHYADAWQVEARLLVALGRMDEAAAPLDRCTAISPTADDCRLERAFVAGNQGECATMDEHLRIMAGRPQATYPYVLSERANALFALGRPDETVLEVFAQLEPIRLPGEREGDLIDRALLDIARGRFARAESRLLEAGGAMGADVAADLRIERALTLALLYLETGRVADAALTAEDYFSRREAWLGASDPEKEMMLLRAHLHTGRLSESLWAARRAGILARAAGSPRRVVWSLTHLLGITTPEEADAARSALSELSVDDFATLGTLLPSNVFMGRLELLTGTAAADRDALARAVATLHRATSGCWELRRALLYNPARLDLGRAREALGDTKGACAAYAALLAAWGHADAPSLSAESAREGMRRLACEPR